MPPDGPQMAPQGHKLKLDGYPFQLSINNSENLTLSKRHPESQVRSRGSDFFPLNIHIQPTFLNIQISIDKYGRNSVPNSSRQEKDLCLALDSYLTAVSPSQNV